MSTSQRGSLEPYLRDDVEYYDHQITGIRKLAKLPSFILADDMGLGKSLQALTVFAIDVKLGKAKTLMIVCPVGLRANWAEEIEKFTRFPYVRLGEVPDSRKPTGVRELDPDGRRRQLFEFLLDDRPRILITNYEQVASAFHSAVLQRTFFDVNIFDEAHYIKNPESNRAQAALALNARRNFMLTGTPILNDISEIWPLLHKVDPRRWPKFFSFRNRYCVFGGYNGQDIIATKNTEEITAALGEVMLRRVKDNVLTLPKPYYVQVMVNLTDRQRELYDEVAEEFDLSGGLHGGGSVEDLEEEEKKKKVNPLTRFLRLKQICGTPAALDPELPDESAKLDRAVEIIAEQNKGGEKVIVFTQFREVLTCLARRLEVLYAQPAYRGIATYQLHGDIKPELRQGVVKAWSNHKGPANILCTTQVAGVGLNMTAARVVVFIDKLFVPGLNKQAVDRAHRIGQDESQPVQVFELIARNTVESRVEDILRAKGKLFENVVEGGAGMRQLLEELAKMEAESGLR